MKLVTLFRHTVALAGQETIIANLKQRCAFHSERKHRVDADLLQEALLLIEALQQTANIEAELTQLSKETS